MQKQKLGDWFQGDGAILEKTEAPAQKYFLTSEYKAAEVRVHRGRNCRNNMGLEGRQEMGP